MLCVAFRDDVDNTIRRRLEVEYHESYIPASLLAFCASIGMLNTPEIVGSLAEGLGFSHEVRYYYQDDISDIAAIGSRTQLLYGASSLVENQLESFAQDTILAAIDGLQICPVDTLTKVRFIV